MRKSKNVPATFLAGLATAMLSGCSSQPPVRRCVDLYGNAVPDIECRQADSKGVVLGHWGYVGQGYYGGGGGGVYVGGGGVRGGGGVSGVSTDSGVSRGGFGDAAGGFGRGGFGAG